MTFSIAARCPRTGAFGIAVTSSSPAVAARCAHVRPGVGAACSQNVTDPRLGTLLLDRLTAGRTAPEAVAGAVTAAAPHAGHRQLTVIGVSGAPAAHTGHLALGVHAQAIGADAVAAGNLLADPGVPAAMVEAFGAEAELPLASRLLAALRAGAAAGGEAGPVHSAGLLVAGEVAWPRTDLRIDWDDDPVARLTDLWKLWEPQEEDYVRRALAPDGAPSYGVPGDE